jgi:hypothetical protein
VNETQVNSERTPTHEGKFRNNTQLSPQPDDAQQPPETTHMGSEHACSDSLQSGKQANNQVLISHSPRAANDETPSPTGPKLLAEMAHFEKPGMDCWTQESD